MSKDTCDYCARPVTPCANCASGATGAGPMNVPFASMKVTYRQQYPGGYPMFVVRFTGPRPPNGERVATIIKGVDYGGPIIGYDAAKGECEAQLFPSAKGAQQ